MSNLQFIKPLNISLKNKPVYPDKIDLKKHEEIIKWLLKTSYESNL
jgi:hypothetical protein